MGECKKWTATWQGVSSHHFFEPHLVLLRQVSMEALKKVRPLIIIVINNNCDYYQRRNMDDEEEIFQYDE